jgi:hypothetical protein
MPRRADWPLILAGPIVRRVESRLASAWVALKAPRAVRLDIWQGLERGDTTRTPLASGTTRTERIGDNLHVVVATVQLPDNASPLLPGQIYSYNLTLINDANNAATNLRSMVQQQHSGCRPRSGPRPSPTSSLALNKASTNTT